jgi:hypothetical protein
LTAAKNFALCATISRCARSAQPETVTESFLPDHALNLFSV